jgi:hypothetical protein
MYKHEPLELFKGQPDDAVTRLYGEHAMAFRTTCLTHTIHRQAAFGLFTEVIRHPLCWCKNGKAAQSRLTPEWAATVVEDMVDSILIVGYVGYKVQNSRIVVAPPASLDLVWDGSDWAIAPAHADEWSLSMHTTPHRPPKGGAAVYRTPAALAALDTARYDEMSANINRRDHYNSRPAVFTSIDAKLKNTNGNSRQWFQQATSADAAAMRNLDVDTSFQSLIAKRADTINRLEEMTALHRERLTPSTSTIGKGVPPPPGNMHHQEHIVTDGREAVPSRQLLSLADGEHVWNKLAFDIFFAFRVPPQVLGININAERTSINPRLNELVLNMFFFTVSRIREVITTVFKSYTVAGATLGFIPTIAKADLDRIGPALKRTRAAAFYAGAYDLDEDVIDTTRLGLLDQGAGAKRTHRDDEGDGELKG